MPYSGPNDPKLPANVQKLPEEKRSQWVHVWNNSYQKCQKDGGGNCESVAFRNANGVALADMQTRDINGVEILREGTWNGVPFPRARLDQIVESHTALRGILDSPVKLGHSETQRLLQADGYPAAGWIENVRRVGSKLYADLRHVPAKVADLIDVGAIRKRSSEIRFDFEAGGRTWPAVLTGLALLGEQLPAVDSLSDMVGLYQTLELEYEEGVNLIGGTIEITKQSAIQINGLPDSAFAGIDSGGIKDKSGKTTPRSRRYIPHHSEGGVVDENHIRNALRQLQDVQVPSGLKASMFQHLKRHASEAGITIKLSEDLERAGKDINVELEAELRTALGLGEDVNVVEAIQGLVTLHKNVGSALKIDGDITAPKIVEAVANLSKPDPGKGDDPKVTRLETDLAETRKELLTIQGNMGRAQAEGLVTDAIKEGRLLPRQKDVALKLALESEAVFTAFLATQPKGLVDTSEKGMTGRGNHKGVDLADLEPTDLELEVGERLGVSRVDLIKARAKQRGIDLPADFEKSESKKE